MMPKYLLTYEDAREIAKRYNNNNFREFQYTIHGYKVAAFDYFICGWNDFTNPLQDKPHIHAFDMRGTTFVFGKDGKVWKRFFMLPKFFNLNQVEATQYDKLKNKKIIDITVKEDGSLVAFMKLPDNTIFSKTIGSFTSDQARLAYDFVMRDKRREDFVRMAIWAGYTPLFEYVSGPNRIVLKYSSEDLRFLGVRDNFYGKWMPASELQGTEKIPFNIPETEKGLSLYDLVEKAKVEENKEGWVVRLSDIMIKIKTQWYFNLHGIRTENVFREDYVIKNYLEQTLDDVLSQLDPKEDNDAFKFVAKVTGAIDNYISYIDECTTKLREKYYGTYKSNWLQFAKENSKEPYFGLSRNLIETPDDYNRRKVEMILKKAYKLKKAEQLIERWKNE